MFIDPEPKRHTHSSMARTPSQTSMSSAYHSAGRPDTAKRKPLEERSQSENNRRQPAPSGTLQKPTVRLVRTASPTRSPLSSSDTSSPFTGDLASSNFYTVRRQLRRSSASDRLGSSSSLEYGDAGDHDSTLNDTWTSAASDRDDSGRWRSIHETKQRDSRPTISLLSSHPKDDASLKPAKYRRHSGPSVRQSLSSSTTTLRDNAPSQDRHDWISQRISQGTTLRGTPTPTEQELRDLIDREKEFAKSGAPQILETLPEASPERPSGAKSKDISPTANRSSESESNWHAVGKDSSRPQSSDSDIRPSAPDVPRWNLAGNASELSLPDRSTYVRPRPALSTLHTQPSRDSVANSFLRPSSPIVVVYESDSSQPRSRSHAIHYTPSVESIQSRLQYPTIIQPQTSQSLVSSNSLASLRPSSPEEADVLPPLHIPRRRSRQQAAALTRASANASSSAGNMEADDLDTAPYPRQQFQAALSTILSEGDAASNHPSHFSLGSGVLTEDFSDRQSGTWPRMRRTSTLASFADDEASNAPGTAQSEMDADGAFPSFRQISAKPPPLFRAGGMPEDKRYHGLRPPVPPIPGAPDTEENFDTVSELQTPSLKAKRSGYSLRRRSNSTPSGHTRQSSQVSSADTNRRSNGSSIFPAWAKVFYSGAVGLVSPSKTSLQQTTSHKSLRHANSHKSLRQLYRAGHRRGESAYTVRSITSRLGNGESIDGDASSPTSSHFLPSIFRHKTKSDRGTDAQATPKSKGGTSSGQTLGAVHVADSVTISVIPNTATIVRNNDGDGASEELLPSGHPRWGRLKDEPETRRPLPRSPMTQSEWDELTTPRQPPRESVHNYSNPRLLPSKRASQSRLSLWRPPSFVDSIDSLFRSKVNRQIILFAMGFVCPLLWMLAAFLPLPKKPISASELEKSVQNENDDRVQAAMMQHQAGNAETRWREERIYLKAQWWRWLNRIMSVIGVLVIAAVIALAIIATR